jgi:hypothetical protein
MDMLSTVTEAVGQLDVPAWGWLGLIVMPLVGMALGVADADQRRARIEQGLRSTP